jgi:hypothetical protein
MNTVDLEKLGECIRLETMEECCRTQCYYCREGMIWLPSELEQGNTYLMEWFHRRKIVGVRVRCNAAPIREHFHRASAEKGDNKA